MSAAMHPNSALRIALVVQGRFHAVDLAGALMRRGHEPVLLTNYPRWAIERFGFPATHVRSFWPHGVLERALGRIHPDAVIAGEQILHRLFGQWAKRALSAEHWDIVHIWSGVAEETLQAAAAGNAPTLLMRGSAHILTQTRLLKEEMERTGRFQRQPSRWMIAREQREYTQADRIVVLSRFAYDTFVGEGIPPSKLRLVGLGASLEAFRPAPEVIQARRERIESGARLRVLYVGQISFRKGLWDLAAIIRHLDPSQFEFRLVGSILPEATQLVEGLRGRAIFTPKQAQMDLPAIYAWGDVFVFPTIEDGFGLVVAQAAAAGLPILTTTHCAGPDLIQPGETGWVVPIRAPDALEERLQWCHNHRSALASMVARVSGDFRPRSWEEVSADFEAVCVAELGGGDSARRGAREAHGSRS